MTQLLRRVKFNQPSKLQPHHDLDGRFAIADMSQPEPTTTVYFTEGPVHSMVVQKLALEVMKLSASE